MLNPFAALFQSYKNILVRGEPPTIFLLYAALTSLIVLVIGLSVFDRGEAVFAKEL